MTTHHCWKLLEDLNHLEDEILWYERLLNKNGINLRAQEILEMILIKKEVSET